MPAPERCQVNCRGVFSRLAAIGYDGWAMLVWECCMKQREDGTREGAPFIAWHMIAVTPNSFHAGLRRPVDAATAQRILGIAP